MSDDNNLEIGRPIGQELVDRLRAFNDRLIYGQSFERVTRVRCPGCSGTGMTDSPGHPAMMSMCPVCGGNGATEQRERIDPSRVVVIEPGGG